MKRIKDVRTRLGLSLSEVALRSGLHRRAVARVELEKHDPRASTIAAIAKAMSVPVCELFDESGHDRGAAE
jgi:transcriptional regulator with XRE-family HTH domain